VATWAGHAEWRRRRYRLRRRLLIQGLGGCCARCGSTKRLELHHFVAPRNWTPNRLDQLTRLRVYEQDAEDGLLMVLCTRCHREAEREITTPI
jgi:5-methylcytosine-specific restriction endonuclease McrA